jgi:hypothetical protein
MRRLALVLFAFAALFCVLPRAERQVLVPSSDASTVHAASSVASSTHIVRGGAVSGLAPSAVMVWFLAMCALLGVVALTQPAARSHARSGPSRAPPRLV